MREVHRLVLGAVLRWTLVGVILAVLAAPVAGPLLTGTRWIVVTGGSMEPTLSVGDVIISRDIGEGSLRVGDVVTIEDVDGLYTHRVVEVGAETIRTQGDANDSPDAEPVPREAVLARMVGTLGQPWSSAVTSTRSPAARIALAGLLVALLAPSFAGRATTRRERHLDR